MNIAQPASAGLDFLNKAAIVVLTFQLAIVAMMLANSGLEGTPNGFLVLVLATAIFAMAQRRTANGLHGLSTAWVVSARAIALAIVVIGSLAVVFYQFLPDAAPDAIVQTLFSLIWVMIALKGAAIGKLRPNRYVGLWVYWTKHSRLAWDKAHRVLGRVLFWVGLIGLLTSFFTSPRLSVLLWFATLTIAIGLALFVSWRTWRTDPERVM